MKIIMTKTPVLIALALLIPNTSFATSGACSYHGGVNCSLSNSFASVICNDGSSESSTSYYDLQECKAVTTCSSGSVTAYSASRGLLGSSMGAAASTRCDAINNSQSNTYTGAVSSPSYQSISIDEAVDRRMVDYCLSTYGSNSVYDTQKVTCSCKSGYAFDKNKICSPENQVMQDYCVSTYGNNSSNDATRKTCVCNSGFMFDENKICSPKEQVIERIFQKYFKLAMDTMPEYEGIVDPSVIKTLSINPANGSKTFAQLIVETYSSKLPVKTASTTVEQKLNIQDLPVGSYTIVATSTVKTSARGHVEVKYKPQKKEIGALVSTSTVSTGNLESSTATSKNSNNSFMSKMFKSLGAWLNRFF